MIILSKRQCNALLAIKLSPGGLRKGAHPAIMPRLVEAGLVEERPIYLIRRGEMAWFLTDSGRKALANAEPRELKVPNPD